MRAALRMKEPLAVDRTVVREDGSRGRQRQGAVPGGNPPRDAAVAVEPRRLSSARCHQNLRRTVKVDLARRGNVLHRPIRFKLHETPANPNGLADIPTHTELEAFNGERPHIRLVRSRPRLTGGNDQGGRNDRLPA